jgi:cyclopropane fatty-acyl-phospholipid synthase-like methyltransferase
MTSSFNESYRGTPPWDIGRPQAEFVRIASRGEIHGRKSLMDVGCGTGENAIFFASIGHEVLGLDSAPLAIEKAEKKARNRKVPVVFKVGDALHLERLNRRFDVITDCGLFHTFSDEDRRVFVNSLKTALTNSGTYFMLCFSDKEPADWGGPRRISKSEIIEAFGAGWRINYVREARISTSFNEQGAHAWLSSITSV